MEPILIHYLNYFLTLVFAIFNFIPLLKQSEDFGKENERFCLSFFLREFFMIDVNLVFIFIQLDRLIAIVYPYLYQEEVGENWQKTFWGILLFKSREGKGNSIGTSTSNSTDSIKLQLIIFWSQKNLNTISIINVVRILNLDCKVCR